MKAARRLPLSRKRARLLSRPRSMEPRSSSTSPLMNSVRVVIEDRHTGAGSGPWRRDEADPAPHSTCYFSAGAAARRQHLLQRRSERRLGTRPSPDGMLLPGLRGVRAPQHRWFKIEPVPPSTAPAAASSWRRSSEDPSANGRTSGHCRRRDPCHPEPSLPGYGTMSKVSVSLADPSTISKSLESVGMGR